MSGKTLAIIPVRGGSVGIPRKNARLLRGKPLLAYGIEAALRSEEISAVVVSTEDPVVALLTEEDVQARAAEDRVVATVARSGIDGGEREWSALHPSVVSKDQVVVRSGVDLVTGGPAQDQIVAGARGDVVGAADE